MLSHRITHERNIIFPVWTELIYWIIINEWYYNNIQGEGLNHASKLSSEIYQEQSGLLDVKSKLNIAITATTMWLRWTSGCMDEITVDLHAFVYLSQSCNILTT